MELAGCCRQPLPVEVPMTSYSNDSHLRLFLRNRQRVLHNRQSGRKQGINRVLKVKSGSGHARALPFDQAD